MKSLVNWFERLLVGNAGKAVRKPDLRDKNAKPASGGIRRRSELIARGTTAPDGSSLDDTLDDSSELYGHLDLAGRVEDAGPGKNILRTRLIREDTGTHETLKILDVNGAESDDAGFDPYNTGQFDRYANWSKHSRK